MKCPKCGSICDTKIHYEYQGGEKCGFYLYDCPRQDYYGFSQFLPRSKRDSP